MSHLPHLPHLPCHPSQHREPSERDEADQSPVPSCSPQGTSWAHNPQLDTSSSTCWPRHRGAPSQSALSTLELLEEGSALAPSTPRGALFSCCHSSMGWTNAKENSLSQEGRAGETEEHRQKSSVHD